MHAETLSLPLSFRGRQEHSRRVNTSLCSAIAGLMICVMGALGCTPAQKQTTLQVVTEVNTYIPGVVAAADTVAATFAVLAPADALLIGVADTAFDTGAKTLQALTAAYLANPNATTLQQIQTAVNALEVSINTASLHAVGIKDAATQRLVLAALKGLLTVVTVVFALIQPTESTAMLEQLRSTHAIHLAKLRQYMDAGRLDQVAEAHGMTSNAWFDYETACGF